MSVVSQPVFQVQEAHLSFCAITNTCGTRSRKRNREDVVARDGKQASSEGGAGDLEPKRVSKRPRLADDDGTASNDASCDDNGQFVPQMERDIAESTLLQTRLEDTPHAQLENSSNSETQQDVAKIISLLLKAINESAKEEGVQSQPKEDTPSQPNPTYQRQLPTSPLSDLPERTPFVRKSVGGLRQGCVEPGLSKWVLCKNLVADVRAVHPAFRPPEWIEALHEMGWESYHPDYMAQCDDYIASDHDFDDWVEVDVGNPQQVHTSEREQKPWKREEGYVGEIFLH